jgi:hypothetical protein
LFNEDAFVTAPLAVVAFAFTASKSVVILCFLQNLC